MRRCAGIDETGRGSCIGPLIACAVVFPEEGLPAPVMALLADSKALSARRRNDAYEAILPRVAYGFGSASAAEVDALNPLRATMLAMTRAVRRLPVAVDFLRVDGLHVPDIGIPGEAIVKGDVLVAEISAASILAKVFRDRLISRLAVRYPDYGLERHAGYGTAAHFAAIDRLGATAHHRKTFLRKHFEKRCRAEKEQPGQ